MVWFFTFFSEIIYFILSFLLVFAIFLGVLLKSKIITDDITVNSIIAFVIGIVVAFSGAVPFIIKIVPYFALLIIMFASMFLVFSLFGFKLEYLLKSKFVVWIILITSVLFVFFTAWNLYYDDFQEQLHMFTLSNVTLNDTEFEKNLTGNPFNDVPLKYEYQCMRQGRYLSPLLFFGNAGILCLVMHPRVLGVIFVLGLFGLVAFLITRYSTTASK
jgi:hypothetical protein